MLTYAFKIMIHNNFNPFFVWFKSKTIEKCLIKIICKLLFDIGYNG